jgi:hypothetical protein
MEPQQAAELAYVVMWAEQSEKALKEIFERLERAERELALSVKRRDSVEIGTPARGGSTKYYLDFAGAPEENDRIIAEGKRCLAQAGGNGGA